MAAGDPQGRYVLNMKIDEEESALRTETVYVIELSRILDRTIESGIWSFRAPGVWHCHDSYTVALSKETIAEYRAAYRAFMGTDPIAEEPASER